MSDVTSESPAAATASTTARVELRPYRPPYATQSAVGTPAPTPAPTDETVTVTLDGVERTVPKGQLIITAADEAGVYIPRFCYHPRMKPVGMCRMCLVEVVGPRGSTLMPACYNPVADGMEIKTTSDMTKKAQDGVLEFLLVNHPLDCPVCDKGGECPLQDQTLAYGPGESRFVEEKRHWDKPIPISGLVNLDRERCIQCGRCVRFADEVAGDPLIDFAARGDSTEVATFPDLPYSSYFSGNVVQICPVGALTATPYRFRARPWDLEQVESTCTSCAVGCRVAVQSSSDELTRYIGVDSDPVNWGWMCDKGRWDFEAVESPERLRAPMVRKRDELVEVGWAEALRVAAEGIDRARGYGTGSQVAVLGGARLPNEDAYAWAKTARVALRTDNVDAQLGDGLPAEVVLGLPRATIDEAAAADVVVLLSGDVKDELPVLYLRLRDAATRGQKIVEVAPSATGMTRYATTSLRYRPGRAAATVRSLVDDHAEWFAGDGKCSVVVVLGRPSLAEPADGIVEAARILAGVGGVTFLPGLRRANVHGALDMGLAPGVLPGRVSLDEGRSHYEEAWAAPVPREAGLDAAGILDAATHGRIGALVLVGADPAADFPDHQLARRALDGARFVVAVDTFLTESSRRADVVLPAATYAERRGTFTNLEGRVTWLGQMVTAPGVAWPDWMIASELAARLGHDFGWSTIDDVWAEVEATSPLHAGLSYDLLASREARDGVVVPLDGTATLRLPRRLDPMADAGILTAESHAISAPDFYVQGGGVTRESAVAEADAPVQGDTQDAPTVDVAVGGGAGPAPAPLRFPARGSAPAAPAEEDDASLLLVSPRTLWDGGTSVARSHSLAGLAPAPAARLGAYEATRRRLAHGATVRVSSAHGDAVLPLVVDEGVAPGTLAVTFNLPGGHAGDLIDASAAATAVTVTSMEGDPA